jgi:hypothetical protein
VKTGTGDATFSGSYTGSVASDTFNIEITTGGAPGTAKYKFWKTSAPATSLIENILTTTQPYLLVDGVSVKFANTGTLNVADKWTVVVKTPTLYSGNMYWSFTTGSGSILSVPTSVSTSVIGTDPTLTLLATEFKVTKTNPPNAAFNQPTSTSIVTITFSKAINQAAFNNDMVRVFREPVGGEVTGSSPGFQELGKSIVISGNTMTVQLL